MPTQLQNVTLDNVTLESTYAPPTVYDGVLAVTTTGSPYINAYRFTNAGGFVSKYANPSSTPGSFSRSASFNPTASVLACTSDSGAGIHAYAWSIDTGFGTKYSNPGSTSGLLVGCNFHPDGNYLGVAGDGSQLAAYAWNNSTGFGAKTNAASVPGTAWPAGWNKVGTRMMTATTTGSNPKFGVWPFSAGTFGTKFTNPVSYLNSGFQDGTFHPNDEAIAMAGTDVAPGVLVYAWDNTSGFGARYSDPTSAPSGGVFSCQWSPSGATLAFMGGSSAPFFYTWSSSTGFGTKFSNPSSAITGTSYRLRFAPTGDLVALSASGSPYIQVYKWSDSTGFGTKYANPTTTPGSESNFPAWAKSI